MLFISNKQLEVFEIPGLRRFEDEMVEHVKGYFPNHFSAIGENGIRNTIGYAYKRAKSYGFTTQRNVCKYLNNMIIMGSNFDADPLHPWAHSILHEDNKKDSKIRIDKLSSKAIEVMTEIAGETHLYLNRTLLDLNNKSDEIFKKLINSDLTNASNILNGIFPQKLKSVGETNLNNMMKLGVVNANRYGIKSESCVLVYLLFMFLIGSGFDKDPQFAFASKNLNDKGEPNEGMKVELLFKDGMTYLKFFLSTINN